MSKLGVIGKTILDRYPCGFFSLDQIAEATKLPRKSVNDTLFGLFKEGLIKKIAKQRKEHIPGHPPRFSITYTGNRKALAARIGPRPKEETAQDAMWAVIRRRPQFDLRDLIVLASAEKGTARWYIKALRRAGYIVPSRKGGGLGVEWKLMKDSGPKRPFLEYRTVAERERRRHKRLAHFGLLK
jgi:hypothetical protein